jgi:hypothetical protein
VNHSDAQNSIADYLDGELSLEQRARLDAHLDSCADCTREVEELREIPHLLSGLPDEELPPMLAQDVMRRIRLGEGEQRLRDRVLGFLTELTSPGIAIPAAAMFAAFFLAVTSGQFEWSPVRTTPRALTAVEQPRADALAPIPREAAALARQIFRSSPELPVSRAERGGDGTLIANQPRAVFELLPASAVEGGGPLQSGPQRARVVVRRPSLGARFAEPGLGMPRSADDWLAVVLHEPTEFARRQASLSLAEREHWIRVLARRSMETGSAEAVLAALRRSGTPQALGLAAAFVAQVQQDGSGLRASR